MTRVILTDVTGAGAAMIRGIEADVMARTLWGEARGEGTRGMAAVAAVVLNRVAVAQKHGGVFWWGGDVIRVCQKPYQFSCWNRADPNYRQLMKLRRGEKFFDAAMGVAKLALARRMADITNGATHYHAQGILPHWARGVSPCAVIGRHVFYRL